MAAQKGATGEVQVASHGLWSGGSYLHPALFRISFIGSAIENGAACMRGNDCAGPWLQVAAAQQALGLVTAVLRETRGGEVRPKTDSGRRRWQQRQRDHIHTGALGGEESIDEQSQSG
jgi:hypothetical protein